MNEKHRHPGDDGCCDIDDGEERDDVMDAEVMEHDAKPDRDELDAGQPWAETCHHHRRAHEGVGFRLKAPESDPEVGKDPIHALRENIGENHGVPENASRSVPAPVEPSHPNASGWRTFRARVANFSRTSPRNRAPRSLCIKMYA